MEKNYFEEYKNLARKISGNELIYCAGGFVTLLAASDAVFDIYKGDLGSGIAMGFSSLVAGFLSYKLFKKTNDEKMNLKNLETKLNRK